MSSLNIIAGSTSSVDIFLDIENAGDDAFQAILSFILPASTLQLVNVFNQTRRGEVSGYTTCDKYRSVPGKRPLLGNHPCTPFQGVNVAASIQIYGILILGKHPCRPKLRVMFKHTYPGHYGMSSYI